MLEQLLKGFLLFASKIAEMQHPVSEGRKGYREALRRIRAREGSKGSNKNIIIHLESNKRGR